MSVPDFSRLTADNIVAFLGDIFARRGAESYLGERVTMSEHMLQAALFAQAAGASEELVVAALLHDIGHYTNEFPEDALEKGTDTYHETAGAAVLSRFFPEVVVECVRQHVAAKRFLCAVDADYFGRLSEASVHTLALQGGPMSEEEARDFAKKRHAVDIVQVRIWDDEGKVPGLETPSFDDYAPMIGRVVAARGANLSGAHP